MTRKTPDQFAQIIRREFLKAVEDSNGQCVVLLVPDAEEIHVNYHDNTFVCDCDSDEEFIFVSKNEVVAFPIPADYLEN